MTHETRNHRIIERGKKLFLKNNECQSKQQESSSLMKYPIFSPLKHIGKAVALRTTITEKCDFLFSLFGNWRNFFDRVDFLW